MGSQEIVLTPEQSALIEQSPFHRANKLTTYAAFGMVEETTAILNNPEELANIVGFCEERCSEKGKTVDGYRTINWFESAFIRAAKNGHPEILKAILENEVARSWLDKTLDNFYDEALEAVTRKRILPPKTPHMPIHSIADLIEEISDWCSDVEIEARMTWKKLTQPKTYKTVSDIIAEAKKNAGITFVESLKNCQGRVIE